MHKTLFSPKSIAVIGGSNNIKKPGGRLVQNLVDTFKGEIYIVNPNEIEVQGKPCYKSITNMPNVDMAILAIPAQACVLAVSKLAKLKNTKAFIIISAGFSELNNEGKILENELKDIVNSVNGTLIGPNCIGIATPNFCALFTKPVSAMDTMGCDLISGSGATAVFITESAISKGLTFANIISVGNSTQTGVEDILQYFDESFDPKTCSKVKLLYIESIQNPTKLLLHAQSLIAKGCSIVAIKAGSSAAGERAAMSHTGAMANPDLAIDALFRKAGIIRCYGREELTTIASVLMHNKLSGKRIAIITHAGGPAVMLTDALSNGGLEIPNITGPYAESLLKLLPTGSSVKNPIDFLATGTANHLDIIIDYCENKFEFIDAMVVIFGSTGLNKVYDVYDVLHQQMQKCKKPIFPILPSVHTAEKELDCFIARGHINFPDEVMLGQAISRINSVQIANASSINNIQNLPKINANKILANNNSKILAPAIVQQLLKEAQLPVIDQMYAQNINEASQLAKQIGYPVVMKVIGPIHKTDIGGVALNVKNLTHLQTEYARLISIDGAKGILIQPMLTGVELFIGAKFEAGFGHLLLCGLGGIFVEVLHDLQSGLVPISYNEALLMIKSLKSYKIIEGTRGNKGVNEELFANAIIKVSNLLQQVPEIKEIDLNPLIGGVNYLKVVDARIIVS